MAVASDGCASLRDAAVGDLEWLFALALRLSHNRFDAEDLVQETLTRACERLDPDRSDSEKRAWLKRVLSNLFIDGYRRRRRIDVVADDDAVAFAADPHDEPASATLALRRLTDADVRDAIGRLEPHHREALTLVDLEGLSYEYAAGRLGLPVGTLTSRLNRGRMHLRRELWMVAAASGLHTPEVCDSAAKLLAAHRQQKTTPVEAEFVELHLSGCAKCRGAMEKLRRGQPGLPEAGPVRGRQRREDPGDRFGGPHDGGRPDPGP
jgi:RNA polymerase sigma-70 factor (ECF subfamily)